MKVMLRYGFYAGLFLILALSAQAQSDPLENGRKKADMKQILIDKFMVPAAARAEFLQRMRVNREFIKKLPGFIEDSVYQRTGAEGEFYFVTVAVWQNAEAIENAKREVTTEYQKQKFDLKAFLERLGIRIERGIYEEMKDAQVSEARPAKSGF